jgi:hypothetical protein
LHQSILLSSKGSEVGAKQKADKSKAEIWKAESCSLICK